MRKRDQLDAIIQQALEYSDPASVSTGHAGLCLCSSASFAPIQVYALFDVDPCLEELVIEFETIMRKRDQLDAIIQQALEWNFPMQFLPRLRFRPGLSINRPCRPLPLQLRLFGPSPSISSKRAYTWTGAKEAELQRQRPAWPVDTEAGSESQPQYQPAMQASASAAPPLWPQSKYMLSLMWDQRPGFIPGR
jgi:hypothetical protein